MKGIKKKEIEVIVDPQGGVSIEAVCFKGSDCEKATEFLEKALGKTINRKRKAEFYSGVRTNRNIQRIGGR